MSWPSLLPQLVIRISGKGPGLRIQKVGLSLLFYQQLQNHGSPGPVFPSVNGSGDSDLNLFTRLRIKGDRIHKRPQDRRGHRVPGTGHLTVTGSTGLCRRHELPSCLGDALLGAGADRRPSRPARHYSHCHWKVSTACLLPETGSSSLCSFCRTVNSGLDITSPLPLGPPAITPLLQSQSLGSSCQGLPLPVTETPLNPSHYRASSTCEFTDPVLGTPRNSRLQGGVPEPTGKNLGLSSRSGLRTQAWFLTTVTRASVSSPFSLQLIPTKCNTNATSLAIYTRRHLTSQTGPFTPREAELQREGS